MLSRSAEYAIRALTYLAGAGDRWVLNREIAEELELPPQFLTKILGVLAHAGLLESQRGRTGGFRLTDTPARIRLLQIVEPFDRLSTKEECLLGQRICSASNACPLHDAWRKIREEYIDVFRRTTLEEILRSPAAGAFPRPGKKREHTPRRAKR